MEDPSPSFQRQFDTAVKLVDNLPGNGTFTPSDALKLKFYAFFKQATVGPCTAARPSFWDVIKKAKWEAWKSVSTMSKSEAQSSYVNLLREVVDTMSYSEDVQFFLSQLGYSEVDEDDDAVTNTKVRSVKTHCNGELNKISNGETEINRKTACISNGVESNCAEQNVNGAANGRLVSIESDEEVFDDASEIEGVKHSVNQSESNNQTHQSETSKSCLVTQNIETSKINGTNEGNIGHVDSTNLDTAADYHLQKSRESKRCRKSKRKKNGSSSGLLSARAQSKDHIRFGRTTVLDECSSKDLVGSLRKLEHERRSPRQVFELSDADFKVLSLWNPRAVHTGHKKSRGQCQAGVGSQTVQGPRGSSENQQASAVTSRQNGVGRRPEHVDDGRSRRSWSRSDSTTSQDDDEESPSTSSSVDWDPRIGVVLLRMHKELQRVSQQLDLMQAVLVTQQRTLAEAVGQKLSLSKLPLSAVIFAIVWPLFINSVFRWFCAKWLRRRR